MVLLVVHLSFMSQGQVAIRTKNKIITALSCFPSPLCPAPCDLYFFFFPFMLSLPVGFIDYILYAAYKIKFLLLKFPSIKMHANYMFSMEIMKKTWRYILLQFSEVIGLHKCLL